MKWIRYDAATTNQFYLRAKNNIVPFATSQLYGLKELRSVYKLSRSEIPLNYCPKPFVDYLLYFRNLLIMKEIPGSKK
jgi:hypothetical protein